MDFTPRERALKTPCGSHRGFDGAIDIRQTLSHGTGVAVEEHGRDRVDCW